MTDPRPGREVPPDVSVESDAPSDAQLIERLRVAYRAERPGSNAWSTCDGITPLSSGRTPRIRFIRWQTLAAAALLLAFALKMHERGLLRASVAQRVASQATTRAESPREVAVTFVLPSVPARRVSVVGDFNRWDPDANPLTRDTATGRWQTSIPIMPGLHSYAFLVDRKTWSLDPLSARGVDDGFGPPTAAILVPTPDGAVSLPRGGL